MENKIKAYEQYYENVVDYFINQYKWKASVIPYKDFLVGYSLFEIGNSMGFENSVLDLISFLENANVPIRTDKEDQTYQEVKKLLEEKKEQMTNSL